MNKILFLDFLTFKWYVIIISSVLLSSILYSILLYIDKKRLERLKKLKTKNCECFKDCVCLEAEIEIDLINYIIEKATEAKVKKEELKRFLVYNKNYLLGCYRIDTKIILFNSENLSSLFDKIYNLYEKNKVVAA